MGNKSSARGNGAALTPGVRDAGQIARDPVAITGIACRFPGAPSAADFWKLLLSGGDAVEQMPDRTRLMQKGGAALSSSLDNFSGGYLPDIDKFDANFFRLSPDEAIRLDPQHRLLMEVVWEALEDAGLAASRIAGTRTGVYTSSVPTGYWDLLRAAGALDLHSIIGAGPWQVAAGRISYELDLRGTSMGVEATCATSLLAVHLACRALWAGEIEMAIVGGANVVIDPEVCTMLVNSGVLSRAGRCRFGDAAGDGYVRSEGVAAIMLKPCRQAVIDGDRVYALITGTSATHDGRSGRTQFAPGVASQEQMLRLAYADAGISPGDVDYVEAHGPGTPAGDPVELMALQRVMGEGRQPGQPCIVGSVKSNIGHCEGASGLAGLLKATFAIQHGKIPATLHVADPHPVLEHADGLLTLPASAMEWPRRGHPATAGVSAFGVSGTNAHVVLTEPPASRRRRTSQRAPAWLLPVSARDPEALRDLAQRYRDRLEPGASTADVHDICYSAGARREHHEYRLAVLGSGAGAMAENLRSFVSGARPGSVSTGPWPAGQPPRVVFVFPGQGPRWRGRGTELLTAYPAFARRMRECDRALEAEAGWTASRRLADGDDLVSIADVQPVTWAIQVSLAALWQDWGIQPDAVVGHSMGEIAAATVAGALTVREAAAVICKRSKLLATLSGRGAMWAVQLDEDSAREAVGAAADKVSVGVINSENSVVLAGEIAATNDIAGRLREQGVVCKRLPVDAASHAPLVEELRPAMLAGLRDLQPVPGQIPMFSTVTDEMIDTSGLTASYWMDNLRSPVRFASAVRSLLAGSGPRDTLFLELSPHPTLLWAVEDLISSPGVRAACVPSLRPDTGEVESMLASLGRAFVLGCAPDWNRIYPGGSFTRLPAYPWNRSSHWPTVTTGRPARPIAHVLSGHSRGTRRRASAGAGRHRFVPLRTGVPAATGVPVATSVSAASSLAARPDVPALAAKSASIAQVTEYIAAQVSDVLAVDKNAIDVSAPLPGAGLDSLRALRLRERVQQEFGVQIPIRDLLSNSTLAEVSHKVHGLMATTKA
jgi:acyl transferase domain-containing protein